MVKCKIQGTGLQGVSKKTAATLKKNMQVQGVFWTNNSKFLLQAGSNSDNGTQEWNTITENIAILCRATIALFEFDVNSVT